MIPPLLYSMTLLIRGMVRFFYEESSSRTPSSGIRFFKAFAAVNATGAIALRLNFHFFARDLSVQSNESARSERSTRPKDFRKCRLVQVKIIDIRVANSRIFH
jgi:hypothetical protein